MCYAKPGTRCLSHVVKDLKKLKADLRDAQEQMDEFEGRSELTSAEQKTLNSTHEKIEKLQSKIEVLEQEKFYTKQGLAGLRHSNAQIHKHGTNEEIDAHNKLYKEAQEVYRSRADAYDKIHGTVDYRTPASNVSDLAYDDARKKVDELNAKVREAERAYKAEQDSQSRDKAILKCRSVIKEYKSAQEAYWHIAQTREHVNNGYIDNPTSIGDLKRDRDQYVQNAKDAYQEYQSGGVRTSYDYAFYSKNMAVSNNKMIALAQKDYRITMPCLKSSSGETMHYGMTYSRDGKTAYWENYKTGEKVEYNEGVANEGKKFSIRGQEYTIGREVQPVTIHNDDRTGVPRIVSNIARMKVLDEVGNNGK